MTQYRNHHRHIVSLLLILSLAIVSFARSSPVVDKISQLSQQSRALPPTQYIHDHDFDARHVALDLKFNWQREETTGTETFLFRPTVANLRAITLDAAEMTITSVKIAGGEALKFDMNLEKQTLRIDLPRAYQPSEDITLIIDYHTNGPQTKLAGLVGAALRFIKPTDEEPTKPRQIWSQGESEYNHYWFPCYDHPNDFFTSEITATVEKPLTVISNGKLLETRDNKDGTRTFHWKIDQPHASYLTSIVVGEFTPITGEYEGIPIITNVYPDQVKEGKATAARLPEMVKFFSEKTGLKYPYAKYAQTMVHDFGGGMENISATTQTDNMIDDARTQLDSDRDGLQSHELAHQWFGDYVTCRDWSDIWLNESFATYFQAMWDEHRLGVNDFLYSDVKANEDAYLSTWKHGNRRPIVTKNYADPDAVFDTYAYPRGGAVLHMLRQTLGEENWWRAINYYLRKYANQPVETEQFRIAIEESTGQAMDWFFDEWLYRMGHPVFRVTDNYDGSTKRLTLNVEQLQTQDPSSAYPQVTYFQMPVNIEVSTSAGTKIERVQILPQPRQTISLSVPAKPLLVNFDYRSTLIKELIFDKSTEELAYQLRNDEDVLGRVWALDELRSRAKTATSAVKQQISAEVANTLAHDSFWGLRVSAAAAAEDLPSPGIREALVAASRDANARVRARSVTTLGVFRDPSLASLYRRLLNDPSYAVIKAAAMSLGATKTPEAYADLVKLMDVRSWRDNIRASALSGLAELRDKRGLEYGLKYSEPGNSVQVRTAALRLIGQTGGDDSAAFEHLAARARAAFQAGEYSLALASGEALVALGNPKGLAVLEQLNGDPTITGRLKTALGEYSEMLQKTVAGRGASGPHQNP